MFIKQLYTGCLSEAAYYIESNGEAAIIDPLRDIEDYLELAKQRNATIKYIFETHFHADFVSGHLDLSAATNAPIIFGPQTKTNLNVTIANDGDVYKVGGVEIKVLHTPGHTLESTCYLLFDEDKKAHAVFTGDTLFVGDVGRPDLAQKGAELTMEDLAGMMYESIQNKIMPLADDVIVYPAHGAGSSCGKNLGKETFSTIGEQKKSNYALNQNSKEDFVKAVTEGLSEPPSYFAINAKINKEGYSSIDSVIEKGMKPLSVNEFKKLMDNDVILLDTRNATTFTSAFIPGAINIGLDGRFAEWAGMLLDFNKDILLVTDPGKEKESIVRLARVGFEKFAGFLNNGMEAWLQSGNEIDMVIDIEPDELAMDIPFDDNAVVIDVRKESEFAAGHIKDAVNIPLNTLKDPGTMVDFEEHHNLYIHCQGGYRSVIAASLLKKQGIHNLRNVLRGWNGMKEQEKLKIETLTQS